jgi:hypothetical protein
MTADSWAAFCGKVVVVDTDSRLVFLGTLSDVTSDFLKLKDVDVHDGAETSTSKERYIMDCKRFGVRPSRKEASVRISTVVSLSLIEDVIEY